MEGNGWEAQRACPWRPCRSDALGVARAAESAWDDVGWDATTRHGRGWLFSRLLHWPVSDALLPYSTSIQYRIWPYVQGNHAPHVDLDGGGGCMLSVSRCLLEKPQGRRWWRPWWDGLIYVICSTSVKLPRGYPLLYRMVVS